jgi:hypothetical protein
MCNLQMPDSMVNKKNRIAKQIYEIIGCRRFIRKGHKLVMIYFSGFIYIYHMHLTIYQQVR